MGDAGLPGPADALKLTSYFGERQRTGGQFVADALLGLYGRHEVATSILLRGTEGFGLKHRLRTDHLLTLSEDLPLTTIAVDHRPQIEALLDEAITLTGSGLVTVERAQLLNGTGSASAMVTEDPEPGPAGATKLTIYLGRQERVFRVPAFMAVCDLLHRRGLDGATALLGVDGTARGNRERAAFFSRNADVPMMVIAVGAHERISQVLPELRGLLERPLITLERVHVCKRDGQLLGRPVVPAAAPDGVEPVGSARWRKLMVYASEAARHDGQPIHQAIVWRLREAGLSGATTLRGVWGFHGDHAPHGDRLLQLSRHVPTVTIVIDRPERIATAFGIIDELTTRSGLITSEIVPTRYRRGAGERVSPRR